MSGLEWLEAASYLVTIVGLPLAIAVYLLDQRRERQTDEEGIFLRLSDEYADFMRLVIDNADLYLLAPTEKGALSEEQRERKRALFAILVSLFERAYVLVYEDNMSRQQQRLWQSWADYSISRLKISLSVSPYPQRVGRGCKAAEAATTTHCRATALSAAHLRDLFNLEMELHA